MDPKNIHRTVLPNGLTVLVQEDRSAPVVAIVTYVKAGYFDETDEQNGLAHALEHMFFKGTEQRGVGDIAKETKASGGYLNAHTIYDNTAYYTVLPSSGFAKGLEIQGDAYANSVIDAGELAEEMEVIIQEAKRKSDNPSAVATETLYELLHDAHRMRRWRIGREPGLRAFTREMMNGFYRNFYQPSNTILSISGDIDARDAMLGVSELYGDLKPGDPVRQPGPPEPERTGFRYRELSGDIAQSQLVFGWRTPGTMDPDTAVLDVAAAVLATGRASRLYRAVREKKLASSITAYDYTPTELGVFVVHAETEPENTAEAARVIRDQLHQLRVGSIEDDELTRVRRIFEARWVRRLETAEGRARYLSEKVRVLVRRKAGAPLANIGVFIVGGAIEDETEQAGLPLLSARTMLKGTTTRTAAQIAEDSEMLGGTISASAGSDSFGFSLSVPVARLPEALELLGDVVQRPTIADDALEVERAVALSNVAMLRDDMFRYPVRLASSAAFGSHPYGTPTVGTEESLRLITGDQAREWHKSRVLESSVVIGIVADVDAREAADIVAREFSALQLKKPPKVGKPRWPKSVKIAAESRDKAQTAIALGFPAPSRSDDLRFAASLIATVASGLGGRFFDELRDRQSLAYTVQAAVNEKRLAGMFLSYIATSPEKEGVARAGLLAEFAKLREHTVSAEELTRAKEYVVGSHAISQESGAALLGEMLDAWMFGEGLQEILEHDVRVRGVTADQMRDVARKYFDPEKRVEGIVRGVGKTV